MITRPLWNRGRSHSELGTHVSSSRLSFAKQLFHLQLDSTFILASVTMVQAIFLVPTLCIPTRFIQEALQRHNNLPDTKRRRPCSSCTVPVLRFRWVDDRKTYATIGIYIRMKQRLSCNLVEEHHWWTVWVFIIENQLSTVRPRCPYGFLSRRYHKLPFENVLSTIRACDRLCNISIGMIFAPCFALVLQATPCQCHVFF